VCAKIRGAARVGSTENKGPSARLGPSTVPMSNRTGATHAILPRRRRRFDPKSVHPTSLYSSGLFVTLCALTDDATCFHRPAIDRSVPARTFGLYSRGH